MPSGAQRGTDAARLQIVDLALQIAHVRDGPLRIGDHVELQIFARLLFAPLPVRIGVIGELAHVRLHLRNLRVTLRRRALIGLAFRECVRSGGSGLRSSMAGSPPVGSSPATLQQNN
jgi:hypothetical protein